MALTSDGKCLRNNDPPLGFAIADSLVDPNYKASAGDLVYLDDATNQYKLCTMDSAASSSTEGLVITAASAKGKGFLIATPGMLVRLKRFGSLAELNALGASHVGYAGRNGRLVGTPYGGRDVYNRRILSLPKRFQDLVQGDLEMGVLFLTDPPVHS